MRRVPRAAGLLVLLGVGAGLCVAEIGLRLMPPGAESDTLRGLHVARPDRPWLYGLHPGVSGRIARTGAVSYRINADGFRDRPRARPKPDGVLRILVVGDSLTFGYGVEEAEVYTAVLEGLLDDGRRDVEVVNLGVGGYNPYNESALLADVGMEYEPDIVLVQFCVNDLNDPTLHFDAQTRLHLDFLPADAFPSGRIEPGRVWRALLSACAASRLCSHLDDLWLRATATEPTPAAISAALAPNDGDADGTEWRWLRRHYAAMARTAAAMDARFGVIVFPHRGQVDGTSSPALQEGLRAMAAEEGWISLDLLPAFLAATDSGPLFLDVWHPSPAGHRVAAEAIAGGLAQELGSAS